MMQLFSGALSMPEAYWASISLKKYLRRLWISVYILFAVGLNIDDEAARKECIELNFEKQEYVVRKAVTWVFGRRIPEAEVRFGKLPCWFLRALMIPQGLPAQIKP